MARPHLHSKELPPQPLELVPGVAPLGTLAASPELLIEGLPQPELPLYEAPLASARPRALVGGILGELGRELRGIGGAQGLQARSIGRLEGVLPRESRVLLEGRANVLNNRKRRTPGVRAGGKE